MSFVRTIKLISISQFPANAPSSSNSRSCRSVLYQDIVEEVQNTFFKTVSVLWLEAQWSNEVEVALKSHHHEWPQVVATSIDSNISWITVMFKTMQTAQKYVNFTLVELKCCWGNWKGENFEIVPGIVQQIIFSQNQQIAGDE